MKKRDIYLTLALLAWLYISPKVKALPVIGGFIGFLEFLALAILVGTILYHVGRHIDLWFKVRRD